LSSAGPFAPPILAAIEALTVIPDPDLPTAYTGLITVDPPAWYRGAFEDALARGRAHAIRVLHDHRPPCAREALSFYVREYEGAAEDVGLLDLHLAEPLPRRVCLWGPLPAFEHAGIATERVVIGQIASVDVGRRDLAPCALAARLFMP